MQIAVCDDEKNVRELLADKIRSLFPSAELALYPSGEALLLADTPTDILLLDIQMPGKDGMQTAREFRAKNRQAAIIFVTALEEYVFQAFDVEAFHYLVKFDRKIILHTLQDEIEYYGKMKELEKKVGEDFYRPHRAYLVNMNYIRKYDVTTIYLEKGRVLMAKQNYQDFVKCYLRFIRRKGTENDAQ